MIVAERKSIFKVKTLVADDSALYRRLISRLLKSMDDVEVLGTAFDGENCLSILEREKPHIVTLDLQMPRLDGMSTLREIKRRKLETDVIVVCAGTEESADQTVQALEIGALDFILKPSFDSIAENTECLVRQLRLHIKTVRSRLLRRTCFNVRPNKFGTRKVFSRPESTSNSQSSPLNLVRSTCLERIECICIGVSTGGPSALKDILSKLPASLPVPIFVVQHMPALFTKSLADHLNAASGLTVVEASHDTIATAGHVYVAPGGKQMKIERKAASLMIAINDDPPIAACKPSVDYLFSSIYSCCGGKTIATILTGMGSDGLEGCRMLRRAGAHIVAQSAESCVVYGMPRQIIDNGLYTEILPLELIAGRYIQMLNVSKCRINHSVQRT